MKKKKKAVHPYLKFCIRHTLIPPPRISGLAYVRRAKASGRVRTCYQVYWSLSYGHGQDYAN